MNSLTDQQLLRGYAERRSEAAFAELVRRYINLVYSAALRMVCDAHLAEDVTQSAFVILAQNAGKLANRPCLSGWLHRTAKNLAVKTVRSDVRRRAREHDAAAMNELLSDEPNVVWTHIAPHLDAALGELSEADRDALLLRYFESKSAREMAQTLGTSEAAAQKRVNRAVERLREFFTKRGLNVGASGLLIVLSAKTVEAAPVGLAVTISSAAVHAGTTLPAHFLQRLSLTQAKLITAAIMASFAISLALLWRQNASLRFGITSLRASASGASRPPAVNTQPSQSATSENELQRLRKEHLELLSLRGRVRQLGDELRERTAGGPPPANGQPTLERGEADSILFSASLTNRVASGNTLVAGGWSTKDGMRRYLLVKPTILSVDGVPDGNQIRVESRSVVAPEQFWSEVGWGAARSDARRSTLASELTSEQLEVLLQALKDAKGAGVSNNSLAERRNGEYVGLAFSISDDRGKGVLMAIDLYSWIAEDRQSVGLEIRPSATPTNTPIHPSLESAEQPSSPATR